MSKLLDAIRELALAERGVVRRAFEEQPTALYVVSGAELSEGDLSSLTVLAKAFAEMSAELPRGCRLWTREEIERES